MLENDKFKKNDAKLIEENKNLREVVTHSVIVMQRTEDELHAEQKENAVLKTALHNNVKGTRKEPKNSYY